MNRLMRVWVSVLFSCGLLFKAYALDSLPLPMLTQYHNLAHYQQALKTWEQVYKSALTCSHNVQLPPMPMPTQYQNLEFYQQALNAWQQAAQVKAQPEQCAGGATTLIQFTPMPMPTQYQNLDLYQQAFTVWQTVYTQAVHCRHQVQLPSMPMPTQYQNLLLYQRALDAWEQAGRCTESP